MTCCLAVSLPNCSLAAADTRITLHFDGQQQHHDGPNDLTVSVASIGRTLTLPFSYRKIRRISDGWAVCAGDIASAAEILNLLKSNDGILFTRARSLLTNDGGLIQRVAASTGIEPDQLRETVVLAAPFGSAAHAWTLGLRPIDERTNRRVPFSAINWPNAVPLPERAGANAELRNALVQANAHPSAFAYTKALASVIATAERYAPDVGPFIQVGLTLVTNGVKRSVYYEGKTSELLTMSEVEFEEMARPA